MKNVTVEEKLRVCKNTRIVAAESFCISLKEIMAEKTLISEVILRDRWLIEMRKNNSIYPDGWYIPPPHGIGVLFGTEANYARMNYKSLRSQENWPKSDIFLNRHTGIIYVYASPVDRETGIIGDWGMTIYFGSNNDIKDHLKLCLELNRRVFEYAQIGMTFAQVASFANNLFVKLGFSNEITSVSDKAGVGVNIGHTVPASYENWTTGEIKIFRTNDWDKISKIISQKRKFLNSAELLVIKPGMALTIEQRLTKSDNPKIPMCSFHTIVIIHDNGKRELLTQFDDAFRLVKMDYMVK